MRSNPNFRINKTSPKDRAGVVPSTNWSGHRPFKAAMLGKVNCRLRQERAAWAVQIPQGSPRQKKLTPFRFPGLRKCQESCISVSSFFFPKSNQLRWASIWGGSSRIGVMVARLTLNRKVVGSIPSRRTICTNGGIGIRARLRIWCPSWACEFDSHFVHHVPYHNGLCAFSKKKGGLQRSGAYRCRVAER